MKLQIKTLAKEAGMTALEVGTVAGSMILTKKFLDFNNLFRNQIAANPAFSQKFFMKHQGAVRFAIGLAGAAYFTNPWVKLVFIGVAAEGLITEIRYLTSDAAGVSFFDKIGAGPGKVTTDAELLQMAVAADNRMGANPTTQYPTTVAANPTTQYPTTVAGNGRPVVNLSDSVPMLTGRWPINPMKPMFAA